MEENECPVCLIGHDPEIHEATLRVHQWFREHIAMKIRPIATPIVEAKVRRQTRKKAA